MTVNYRCIGKGTTNDYGVAQITTGCDGTGSLNGYTGTGKGEVQLIASTSPPSEISSGSLVSGTYPILDAMYYDKGMSGTGNHNNIWTVVEGALNRHEEYTALTNGSGSTHYIRVPVPSLPVKITFDYKAENMGTASAWNWCFSYLNSSNASIIGDSLSTFKNTPYTDWVHIEIELTATSITTTGDKTATQTGDYSGVKSFGIIGRNGQVESRFKNFEMYPF